MGVEVSENPCWVRRATRRSWDKRPDWGLGKARNSFKDIAEKKGFRRRPSLVMVRVGREMDDTSMRTDSGEGRRAPR
jgi:hypothetical protein